MSRKYTLKAFSVVFFLEVVVHLFFLLPPFLFIHLNWMQRSSTWSLGVCVCVDRSFVQYMSPVWQRVLRHPLACPLASQRMLDEPPLDQTQLNLCIFDFLTSWSTTAPNLMLLRWSLGWFACTGAADISKTGGNCKSGYTLYENATASHFGCYKVRLQPMGFPF